MSYPKANLGAIVLPTYDQHTDPITWAEYKERFGIDLEEIFYLDDGSTVHIRPTTKPIYLQMLTLLDDAPLSISPVIAMMNDSAGALYLVSADCLGIDLDNSKLSIGYYLMLGNNKSIMTGEL